MRWSSDRIFAKSMPEPNTGCWLWMLSTDDWGYGRTQHEMPDGRSEGLAHRVSFMLANPEVDLTGLHVHHACKQPSCVNPDHLLAVTPAEHLALDDPGYLRRRRKPKTHCPSGHALDGQNLVLITLKKTGKVSRQCRTCRKAVMQKYHRNRKGANHG